MAVQKDEDTPSKRRFPLFVLVDCSDAMSGTAIEQAQYLVREVVEVLSLDADALDLTHMAFITFARDVTTYPLVHLEQVQVPPLSAGGPCSLGAALTALSHMLETDLRDNTASQRGDFRPQVFLFSAGRPTDDWRVAAQRVREVVEQRRVQLTAIACGPDPNVELLQEVAGNVVPATGFSPESLYSLFTWTSQAVSQASNPSMPIVLPPPPPGIAFDLGPDSAEANAGVPPASETPSQESEQVACSAYYPKEMSLRRWESLLVYISLDDAQVLARIAADASGLLGQRQDGYRSNLAQGDKQLRLRRGSELTIVPNLDGFQFNPPSLDVSWVEDVQRCEFRMQAREGALTGRSTNGSIRIYAKPFLVAEVPISVYVRQQAAVRPIQEMLGSATVRSYRKVFVSYAHTDTQIVRLCRTAAEAMGDKYVMDTMLLQSGQVWKDELLRAIHDADVFQLFWSKAAASSVNVEREWRYALTLVPGRPNFVRPVYWSERPAPIPRELEAYHFQRLDLVALGWITPQPLWRRMFVRG